MKDRIRISFIILCLLAMTQCAYCEDNNADNNKDLDIGKSIFKREKKPKKIKVKTKKPKKEYKIDEKVIQEYSIPTDIYMNVGQPSDKVVKLEGGISKSIELNMADCIELALINNPKIKAAYAKSEMAKYKKWETLSGYTPYLDFSASLNHQKPDLSMLRNRMTIGAFNKYTLGQIGIRQLVWDFGYTQNQYTIDKISYEKSFFRGKEIIISSYNYGGIVVIWNNKKQTINIQTFFYRWKPSCFIFDQISGFILLKENNDFFLYDIISDRLFFVKKR